MNVGKEKAIALADEECVVDAAFVAEKLGLSTEAFWRELKRGAVYGVLERGEGEDAGRMRLTFRYRSRSWMTILEGSVH